MNVLMLLLVCHTQQVRGQADDPAAVDGDVAPDVAREAAATPRSSLLDFVELLPADTGMYLAAKELEDMRWSWESLQPPTLRYLLGEVGTVEPFEPRARLARALGLEETTLPAWMDSLEVAIAADDIATLGQGVWLLRMPDGDRLDELIPADQRRQTISQSGAIVFGTESGAVVCRKGELVAIGKRGGTDSIRAYVVRSMLGVKKESLLTAPAFAGLAAAVPVDAEAMIFVQRGEQADLGMATRGTAPVVVETLSGYLEAKENHWHSQIACRLSGEMLSRPVTSAGRRALRELPASTVAGSLFTIHPDLSGVVENRLQPSLLLRYLSLVSAFGRRPGENTSLADHLSGDVLLVVDGGGGGRLPAAALMLHCKETDKAFGKLSLAGDTLATWFQGSVRAAGGIALSTQEFHGATIKSLPIPMGPDVPTDAAPSLLQPAFALRGDWLVIASSLDYLQVLLPSSESDSAWHNRVEVWEKQSASQQDALVVLANGDTCRQLLMQASVLLAGSGNWPGWISWKELFAWSAARERLGISIKRTGQPGIVTVAKVEAGSSAEGVLQAGDRILGVNGRLLDMEEPSFDLRRRLAVAAGKEPAMLRLMRKGKQEEVALKITSSLGDDSTAVAQVTQLVGDALSMLASWRTVSLSIRMDGDRQVMLDWRLEPPLPAEEPPPVAEPPVPSVPDDDTPVDAPEPEATQQPDTAPEPEPEAKPEPATQPALP